MKTNLKSLLNETKRTQYVDNTVLETAPTGSGTLELFTIGKYVSEDELEKEYEVRGLFPAPLNVLLEADVKEDVNKDHKYIGTHWKDAKGNWCYAMFSRWCGKREVCVSRHGGGWDDDWWFAGVRKNALSSGTQPSSDSLSLELRVKSLENDMEKIKKFLII